MFFSGALDLPWWGVVLTGLVMVQITIAGVTVYLHRCQAHRALDLHPIVSHFFRLWLWMTTGMVTKEWAAIHRKHHAKCETVDDPHSPVVHGINKILFKGVGLYVEESRNPETMDKYGHGTPDDWVENTIYTPFQKWGVVAMAVIDVALFGVLPGAILFGVQMAWIPFWAAGFINGIGHFWGYRNYASDDASRNISPIALWIGGEELHNNHHAYPSSAKFSQQWFEFDLGWLYIRTLSILGLAHVKRVAPKLKLASAKSSCDAETLQAVVAHRFEVMAKYAKSVKTIHLAELRDLKARGAAPHVRRLRAWMNTDNRLLSAEKRELLAKAIAESTMLAKLQTLRDELESLWGRSSQSTEQLVARLEAWCQKAESSGIPQLAIFGQRLRCYA